MSKKANEHPVSANLFLGVGLLLTLVAFAVRLHNLGGDSFWIDEILTVTKFGELRFDSFGGDPHHPPFFYALTAAVLYIFGETEFTARLLSLLAGVLTIPLMLSLGRILALPRVALWAALLLSVSTMHLKYSQEARQYALLLLLTLASYVLLYRGLLRSSWSVWVGYVFSLTLALYTHYGAFLVLATQGLVVVGWCGQQLISSKRGQRPWWKSWSYCLAPLGALGVVVLLIVPWVSRLLTAVTLNVGADKFTDTGTVVPFSVWARELVTAFGMYLGQRPSLWLLLVIIGFGVLAWQRKWRQFVFVGMALGMPLLLILLFQVARGAYARFVIYILPFYLFAAAVAVDMFTQWLGQWGGVRLYRWGSVLTAVTILFLARTPTLVEYEYVVDDWRGVLRYLEENAEDGDVILAFSSHFANGFNSPASSLPYYLDQSNKQFLLLPANQMINVDLNELQGDQDVWVVLLNWDRSVQFNSSAIEVTQFKSWLYLVHEATPSSTALREAIRMVEQLLPFSETPSPRCLQYHDLGLLNLQAENYVEALRNYQESVTLCPQLPTTNPLIADNREALREGILQHLASGSFDALLVDNELATTVLQLDPKNEVALAQVTAVNLMQRYQQQEAAIVTESADVPVRIARFNMPHNGDWGDVILLHPPAELAFTLDLPEAPLLFHSRLGLDPQSWGWGGDGATFVLTVLVDGRDPRELLRQHISNDVADQVWHEVNIPLTEFAGERVTLILHTEAGPTGNSAGDWAGWETPRLMWLMPDTTE